MYCLNSFRLKYMRSSGSISTSPYQSASKGSEQSHHQASMPLENSFSLHCCQ